MPPVSSPKRPRIRAFPSIVAFAFCASAAAQDTQWVQQWETAQRARPASLGWQGTIAPAGEPGTPMTIRGTVYESDGKTRAAGIIVFAHQTDRTGLYNLPRTPGWRLSGWAKTDPQGRFEFRTIRPEPYPSRSIPAHVHFTIEGPTLQRRWTPELRFADDPLVSEREKRASSAAGSFGWVRPVIVKNGTQVVEVNIRISEEGLF
ncbi:MAG TPA: hypothetical protein VMT00_09870 [Thermoanaerobaculia bacterium]|nr:hypothetical protein [Thermoanaerobaculia bacterium]